MGVEVLRRVLEPPGGAEGLRVEVPEGLTVEWVGVLRGRRAEGLKS